MFNASQMVGIYGLFYYLPLYFQAIDDASAILSGVYIIPMILPQLVAAGLTGVICEFREAENWVLSGSESRLTGTNQCNGLDM